MWLGVSYPCVRGGEKLLSSTVASWGLVRLVGQLEQCGKKEIIISTFCKVGLGQVVFTACGERKFVIHFCEFVVCTCLSISYQNVKKKKEHCLHSSLALCSSQYAKSHSLCEGDIAPTCTLLFRKSTLGNVLDLGLLLFHWLLLYRFICDQ